MEKSEKDKLFDKSLLQTKGFNIPEKIFDAIGNGKYNSPVGLSTISVGDEFTLTGLHDRDMPARPKAMKKDEWDKLSDDEKAKVSAENNSFSEWLEFATDRGGLSLATVMGDPGMRNPKFWEQKNADIDDDAVDVDNEKITVESEDGFDCTKVFMPSVRVPALWVRRGLDGLATKTLRCVAVRTRVFQSKNTGETYTLRTRAFVVK